MRKASLIALALSLMMGQWTTVSGVAQDSPSQNQAVSKDKATPATPSASDIAAAKASHKVWVNLETGIYHKGGRWYGKTKSGKFMTVDDAKKAGYKAAKRD